MTTMLFLVGMVRGHHDYEVIMITRSRSRSTEMSDSLNTEESPQNSQDSPSQSQLDSAPKDDYVPQKRKKGGGRRGPPRKPDRWVCIMPETFQSSEETEERDDAQASDGGISLVLLKDPSSNEPRQYLCRWRRPEAGGWEICEVVQFSDQPTRSWFIGNSIQTDGGLYLFTPVDPLFLALPYFLEASKTGKFKSLDDIMEDSECPDVCRVLSSCVCSQQWMNISDIKCVGDSSFYRFNRDRTVTWLKKKVAILSEKLEQERIYVGSGSRTLALADSKQLEVTQGSYSTYACGMICDYLPADLVTEMTDIYGMDSAKRVSNKMATSEPVAKKPRLSGNSSEPLEDYSSGGATTAPPTTKVKSITAAQKKLAKVNTAGMKSLSNFFKKKLTQ